MKAFPGSEERGTLVTLTPGGGLMEQLGTTITGQRISQIITETMKTVLTYGYLDIFQLDHINGMIDPAAQ